ncbi:MAG: hypothetical protein J6Y92_10370 [Lentisphaeria bacterium]|nr:hypothetical protein [Lentisphaeria bacterium]
MDDINLAIWTSYEKIRIFYEKHPGLYKLRIALFLLFTVLFLLILIGVFILLLLVPAGPKKWIFFVIMIGGAIGMLHGMVSNKPWKDLFYLEPEQYRALYDDVGEICHELRTRRIDGIYLGMTESLALVSHVPFLPFLRRDILIVGYPTFCSVDAKALRVLITHELGHLAAAHPEGDMVRNFIEWLWSICVFSPLYRFLVFLKVMPPLPILFFPMEIEQEKAADEYCRKTFAYRDFTEAFTQMVVRDQMEDAEVLFRKLSGTESGDDLAAIIRASRRELPDDDRIRRELGHLLKSANPVNIPHPPFRERVGTANVEALLPCLKRTPDAAEHYLLACPDFERDYNAYLEKTMRDGLDMYKKNLEELREKLNVLDMSSDDPDTFTDALHPARMIDRMDVFNACLDILRERFPDSLSAQATVLSAQMDRAVDDQELDEAAGKLEQLVSKNSMLALQFADTLVKYRLRQGDLAKVKEILVLANNASNGMRGAFNAKLSMDDLLLTSDIPDHYISDIGDALVDPSLGVKKFYLVSRRYDRSVALGSLFLYLVRKQNIHSFFSGISNRELADRCTIALADFNIEARIATKKDIRILEAKGIPAHVPEMSEEHARAIAEKKKK